MATLDRTILDYLKRDGLLNDGHFVYRSGRHSAVLLDRDRLLADSLAASRMGYALAKHFFTAHVETIAAPSIWGAGLAQWVAYFLEPKAKVVYATPTDRGVTIAENLDDLIRGRRVLLVDNLIISGETMRSFDATIEELGATVVGLGTLWNSGEPRIADHEVFGLLNTCHDCYPADQCPVCASGGPPPTRVNY